MLGFPEGWWNSCYLTAFFGVMGLMNTDSPEASVDDIEIEVPLYTSVDNFISIFQLFKALNR